MSETWPVRDLFRMCGRETTRPEVSVDDHSVAGFAVVGGLVTGGLARRYEPVGGATAA